MLFRSEPVSGRVTDRLPDRLVWVDCEMTGLDLGHDELVEIACIVTDGDLHALDDGVDATKPRHERHPYRATAP